MKKFDINEGRQAQFEYQQRTGSPAFPPASGNCWSCSRNIYNPIEQVSKDYFTGEEKTRITGITVEEAGNSLVTGCPHCNRSYCD